MEHFASYDGTPIAYRVEGSGDPLVLIPGGPARPSGYFGDLAGLAADRQLIFFDLRGTGESGTPEDTSTYRVDRHADDVIALIDHLGLTTVDLLGHSAGAGIAIFLAIGHSDRVRKLVLLTPSARVLGIPMVGFEEAWDARKDEPWYAEAVAADEALDALPDDADPAERDRLISLVMPFFYKRWDAVAQAHSASFPPVDAVLTGYYRDYVADAPAMRMQLAEVTTPTLVVAGDVDAMPAPATATAIANEFPRGATVTIPGGHYPWLDDPAALRTTINEFLA